MTGLELIFVVVFVLALAAVCSLLVLRMLGPAQLPESPPFPYRRGHAHRHVHVNSDTPAVAEESEPELAEKK